jgi:hypothetical protein
LSKGEIIGKEEKREPGSQSTLKKGLWNRIEMCSRAT